MRRLILYHLMMNKGCFGLFRSVRSDRKNLLGTQRDSCDAQCSVVPCVPRVSRVYARYVRASAHRHIYIYKTPRNARNDGTRHYKSTAYIKLKIYGL